MRRVEEVSSASAARAAHLAREHALADAGLTPFRDLLRRVAWGHGAPQSHTGALRPFMASQRIRDCDLGPDAPAASRLDQDLQDMFAAFGSLSADAWAQITHSLDAQDWIYLAGHLVALTREGQWTMGRRLLERALGGVGTGMRRQPGADTAMRATLEALTMFVGGSPSNGVADRFERWVFAHGPPPPRDIWHSRQEISLGCEAERVRWDDVSRPWFRDVVSPTLQLHPVVSRAWLSSGPYAVLHIAGLVAALTDSVSPDSGGARRELAGDAAVMRQMLGDNGCRFVLCERRDLRTRDIARLAAFQPKLALEHLESQQRRWGALASRLWDTHQQDLEVFAAAFLAAELLRDPHTVSKGRVVAARVIDRMLPTLRVHDRGDVEGLRILRGLLTYPEVWGSLPSGSQRAILAHPSAAVRLLGIHAIGADAARPPRPLRGARSLA